MNVKQLRNMLKSADQQATVLFEDIYGEDNIARPLDAKVITSMVWNKKECILTNE